MLFRPAGCPPEQTVEHETGQVFVYRRDTLASGPMQTPLAYEADGRGSQVLRGGDLLAFGV